MVSICHAHQLDGELRIGHDFCLPNLLFPVSHVPDSRYRFFQTGTGTLGGVVDPPAIETTVAAQGLSLFLILRSFASGTTALTGVEAISNGIPAFKVPRSKNAGQTLIWMSTILGILLLGITFLIDEDWRGAI